MILFLSKYFFNDNSLTHFFFQQKKVNGLQDQVQYYLENYDEPDFIDDDDVYEEFDLQEDDISDISSDDGGILLL